MTDKAEAVSAPSLNSRRSQDKCTSAVEAGISGSGSAPAGARSLPAVDDRVSEFYELYPEKARTFILHNTGEDPRTDFENLRTEAAELHDGGDRFALTWGGVLREYLEWFDRNRDTIGRFERGEEEFTTKLLNSYHPEYLEKYYAKLMGLHRSVEADYENPHTAMLTLTSSGVYESGKQRGPVDHQLERRAAWRSPGGDEGNTYKRLYDRMNELKDSGRINDWTYVIVEEYHPGPFKKNSGYGHDHPVIIADGELKESDFFDVVDEWVNSCPGAGHEAHDYRHPDPAKRPIKVRRLDSDEYEDGDVVNSAAGYLTKYLYPEGGDQDPLEQPIEQVAHHAIKWATNTRRVRKADSAGEAIKADLCRQKFDRGAREFNHGEKLARRESGRGPDIVCAGCGASWGVAEAESETLSGARLAASGGSSDPAPVVAEAGGGSSSSLLPDEPEALPDPDELPEVEKWSLEKIVKTGEDGEPVELTPGRGGSVGLVRVLGVNKLPLGYNLDWKIHRDEVGGEVQREPEIPAPNRLGDVWDNPPPTDLYSQEGRMVTVRRVVQDLQDEAADSPLTSEVLDELEAKNMDRDLAQHSINKLKESGVLYNPPSNASKIRVA